MLPTGYSRSTALEPGEADVSFVRQAVGDQDDASRATREALQRRLQERNFYTGAIDGSFGPGTARGLRQAYGLEE